ncbi:MAG: DUF120 domain-containing protein [Candidatus Heimdallarchaeota archaeon]|nr:DUF120 domain-containing protein [Candidatus Heimdallarchaeota archaeon]
MKGCIRSGLGRGKKFVAIPAYEKIFEEEIGDKPFHGTLNIEVSKNDAKIIADIFSKGKVYDNIFHENKQMGAIILVPLILKCINTDVQAVGVRPLLSEHQSTILEIVAPIHLREHCNLEDNSELYFEFS